MVQHWWWAVHIWDVLSAVWVVGYVTRPLWWRTWALRGRPAVEAGVQWGMQGVETVLDRWGLVSKGRKRQDTEQGGRKKA